MLKICGICKLDKPSESFYHDKKSKDGLRWHCIACGCVLRKRIGSYETRIRNKELFFDGKSMECNICRQVKPLENFYRDKQARHGYMLRCISCFCLGVGREARELRKQLRPAIVRTETHKSCRSCSQLKMYSDFYKNHLVKDGHSNECKKCERIRMRKFFATPYGKEVKYHSDKKYNKMLVVGSALWWKKKYGYGRKKDSYPKETWKELMDLFKADPRCHYCCKTLHDSESTFDHKIPRSRGGSLEIHNIVVACAPCNRLKNTMTDVEFFDFLAVYVRRIAEARKFELLKEPKHG